MQFSGRSACFNLQAATRFRSASLAAARGRGTFAGVSTIAEIESAIASLPEPQVTQLAAWLEEFRRSHPPRRDVAHGELDALIGTWREDAGFDAAVRAFAQVDEAMWK